MTPHLFSSRWWTPEEDEQMRSMAVAGRTPAEIAFKLKRTIWAVQARARRFRLSFKRIRAKKLNERLVDAGLEAIGKKGGKRSC
jgi:hypothetical protein